MVPETFDGYFSAAAAAAGALIGLLFVAISLRPDSVFGDNAPRGGRALAASSFTGLVNGFFLSMVALIPGVNLGVSATALATISLVATVRLQQLVGHSVARTAMSGLAALTFLAQLGMGIGLITHRHNSTLVTVLAWVTITSLAVSLIRAWTLLQGRHLDDAPQP